MRRALGPLVLLAALARPADADPERAIAVRVSAAFGTFEQLTWAAPEVDLVGVLDLGDRYFASLALGYAILDNHTYLADGRSGRLALAGGMRFARLRVAAELGLEYVGYHADPDLLAEHPDVDQLALEGGLLPTFGFEVSRPVGASTAIGMFARLGLRELTVFETPSGDRERARLVLGGAYLQLQIR